MTFVKGWNQVGNPYTVTINWDDVLEFNKIDKEATVGHLYLFSAGSYNPSPQLAPGTGGFVFAARDTIIQISFPDQTSGGRISKSTSALSIATVGS